MVAEIWQFKISKNGGRPPSWILKITSQYMLARLQQPFEVAKICAHI